MTPREKTTENNVQNYEERGRLNMKVNVKLSVFRELSGTDRTELSLHKSATIKDALKSNKLLLLRGEETGAIPLKRRPGAR